MSQFDTSASNEEEFLHRRLCPDGACVGILDSDGRCKECGMVGSDVTTDPRLRGLKKEEEVTPPPEPSSAPVSAADDDDEVSQTAGDQPDDFEDRRLCPDGACVGVVGVDGTCGVCGTVA